MGNRRVPSSTLFHTLKINPFVSSKITTHFRPSLRLFHITKANHYNNFEYYDFFSLKYDLSKVGSNWCNNNWCSQCPMPTHQTMHMWNYTLWPCFDVQLIGYKQTKIIWFVMQPCIGLWKSVNKSLPSFKVSFG